MIYRPHFSHDFQLTLLDSRPLSDISPQPIQLAIIPHQPHWTSVTAPERVNPILDSFLLRVAQHAAQARDEEDMSFLTREMFKVGGREKEVPTRRIDRLEPFRSRCP